MCFCIVICVHLCTVCVYVYKHVYMCVHIRHCVYVCPAPHSTSLSLSPDAISYTFAFLFFLDNHGACNKLALVQYMFDGPEIEVITKPHGNFKGSTPYFRTSDSARQKLQTLAATKTPKSSDSQEAGGELNIETPSDAP